MTNISDTLSVLCGGDVFQLTTLGLSRKKIAMSHERTAPENE
jgi:hypothetical protein